MFLTPRFGDFTAAELYEGCVYVTQRDDKVWRLFSDGPIEPPAMELIGDVHTSGLATLRVRYPGKLKRAEQQISAALRPFALELHVDPTGNYSVRVRDKDEPESNQ